MENQKKIKTTIVATKITTKKSKIRIEEKAQLAETAPSCNDCVASRHFGFGFGFSGIGSDFRVLRQISGFGSGFGFNKFSGSGSGIQLCRISKTRLLFAVFGFDKNFPNFSFV